MDENLCLRIDPDLGTLEECEFLKRQFIQLKLVGNVIEVKGRGVLLLGTGKSTASLFLTLLHDDVFLVADDYCYVLNYPVHRLRWEPESEAFISREASEMVATAADYPPTGQVGNSLWGYLAREGKEEQARLRQALHLIPWVEHRTTEDFRTQLRRKIQLESYCIDSITQRPTPAHKACAKIDYIFFLHPNPLPVSKLDELLRANRLEHARRWQCYLMDTLFEGDTAAPKRNTMHTETVTPQKFMLGALGRLLDDRGDDWRVLLQNPDVSFTFAFYYDNLLEKVQEIYRRIEPPPRLCDGEERFIERALGKSLRAGSNERTEVEEKQGGDGP